MQSFEPPHVLGLPLQERLGLDSSLQFDIVGQDRCVDFSSIKQEVEKISFGVVERQQRCQHIPALVHQVIPIADCVCASHLPDSECRS